jgi:hypothetical protein
MDIKFFLFAKTQKNKGIRVRGCMSYFATKGAVKNKRERGYMSYYATKGISSFSILNSQLSILLIPFMQDSASKKVLAD